MSAPPQPSLAECREFLEKPASEWRAGWGERGVVKDPGALHALAVIKRTVSVLEKAEAEERKGRHGRRRLPGK